MREDELSALTGSEIDNLLCSGTKPDKKVINERKRLFAVFWERGEGKILFGGEAQKLINEHQELIEPFNSAKNRPGKLRGQVAYKGGLVRSVARILKTSRDVKRVNKGEIIVVSMTTPEFIMAMEKAAAFVTDEGGITCHAAIIAREMQKPCIIGTKEATMVIEDGSTIEVDTEKGLVIMK
jgi:pyruvate,water dikinase